MARILLVDDDAGFREGLADLGHEAVETDSGEGALSLLDARNADDCAGLDAMLLDLRCAGWMACKLCAGYAPSTRPAGSCP